MDPFTAGKLGGKKSLIKTAAEKARTDPTQMTLSFGGSLTLRGPITSGSNINIDQSVKNINVTAKNVTVLNVSSQDEGLKDGQGDAVVILSDDDTDKVTGTKRARSLSPRSKNLSKWSQKQGEVAAVQGFDDYRTHKTKLEEMMQNPDLTEAEQKSVQEEYKSLPTVWILG
jgi:hypothetical protein